MTTSIQQLINWVEAEFETDEAAVMAFLAPLGNQILAAAKALAKDTVQAGLQVIKDTAAAAVTAGATAAATGGNAVQAAEAAFVSVGASEGLTVVKNAEAGAIKAAVAIAQSAVAELEPTPVTIPAS
jgi:hypothetical protein